MAYGIWMKNVVHYNFFHEAFKDNKITFKSEMAAEYVKDEVEREDDVMMKINYFRNVFIVVGVILGVILLFGVIHELSMRRCGTNHQECSGERISLKCYHMK